MQEIHQPSSPESVFVFVFVVVFVVAFVVVFVVAFVVAFVVVFVYYLAWVEKEKMQEIHQPSSPESGVMVADG